MDTKVSHFYHDGLTPKDQSTWALAKNDDGTGTIRGMHIFRAGQFRDSRGRHTSWTVDQLQQMAENFSKLSKIFPDVPVRRDHVRSVDNVIGYFDRVYVSGSDLYGDLRITEPEAIDKFERGTYRSRSIEVGPYESNNGDVTAPAVLGLAMVDIPAVEGLFQRYDPSEEINDMTQEELDWAIAAAYAQAIEDADKVTEEQFDWCVAAGYAEGDTAARAEFAKQDDDRAPFLFQLGDGESTAEFIAVQRRLDALNNFFTEQTSKSRADFVDGLVVDNKIAAPQRDSLVEHVQGLTPEQFASFQAVYENAPKLDLLENHGSQDGGSGGDASTTATAAALATAEETVAFHKRSGMSDEEIQKTESYQTMVKLRSELDKGDA